MKTDSYTLQRLYVQTDAQLQIRNIFTRFLVWIREFSFSYADTSRSYLETGFISNQFRGINNEHAVSTPVCEEVELEDEIGNEMSEEALSFPSPTLDLTHPLPTQLGSSNRESSAYSLERKEEVCFSIGSGIEVVASRTEGVRGNVALMDQGLTLLSDVYTHSNDATFKTRGREYYQPRFNLGDLMGAACSLSERLGYCYGGGAILISDDEKGPPTAAIALVKREDYARKAYQDMAKKWNLGKWRKEVFPILVPLSWYHFGGDSQSTIEAQEIE